MSTPYSEIFGPFMGKKNDYELGPLADYVIEKDNIMIMNNALPNFRLPKIDIFDKDDDLEVFNQNLTYEEIHVIVSLMIVEWFRRMILNTDVLVQKFGETDFEFKSQANQLKALCEGYLNVVSLEAKTAISNYSKTYQGKVFDYRLLTGKKK